MAKRIVSSTQITLGGTDYSAQLVDGGLDVDAPEQDITNMASAGWFEGIGGIKKATLALEFAYDADDSGLQAYLWTNLGASVAFTMRGTSGAIATSNADYQGNVIINKFTPIRGRVGNVHGASYSFPVTGAITRDTTP